MRLIALSLMAVGLLAQTPLPSPFIGGGGGGGGTPGGSNTQCQYNNSGAFGGISGCTTNGTVVTLVAPALGTPSALVLTNATGLPAASILPGTFGAGNYTVNGNLTVGATDLVVSTTSLPTASAPTVTPVGTTGAAHWSYQCQAFRYSGGMAYSATSSTTTITNGNATLDNTNKNNVSCAAVVGANAIEVSRIYDAAMGTPTTTGPIGSVSGSGGTLVDNGLAAPYDVAFDFTVNPTGDTSKGTYLSQYFNQADLGDVANAAWFGTSRIALAAYGQSPYSRSGFSKYVFSHAGTTDNIFDTVFVQYVGDTNSGQAIEAIQYTNNSNGGYGSGLYAEGGNIGSFLSDEEWGSNAKITVSGSGDITNARAYRVGNGVKSGSGSIINYFGYSCSDDLTIGSSSNTCLHSVLNAGSGKYAINMAGTALSHLGGELEVVGLKTTGAATGKTVVCVDVATGQLYASTSGVACAN